MRCLCHSPSSFSCRSLISFINEAAKCLEDEIIENPVVGDIGLVFGTGFAPFRGGPFRYLDQVGVQGYVNMMNGFVDKVCIILVYGIHNR
jgi:3-hydroxyacyl-CoA dehydrogenase